AGDRGGLTPALSGCCERGGAAAVGPDAARCGSGAGGGNGGGAGPSGQDAGGRQADRGAGTAAALALGADAGGGRVGGGAGRVAVVHERGGRVPRGDGGPLVLLSLADRE